MRCCFIFFLQDLLFSRKHEYALDTRSEFQSYCWLIESDESQIWEEQFSHCTQYLWIETLLSHILTLLVRKIFLLYNKTIISKLYLFADMDSFIHILQLAGSQDFNQVKLAEEQLKQWETTSGFYPKLLVSF